MNYLKLTILFLISTRFLVCQSILNGSFETNTANNTDQINLSNVALNAMLPNVSSFGSYGDVDIIKSNTYGTSGAQDKDWYLGITGGGTDIIALTLSDKLIAGKSYSLSFYDRKTNSYPATALQIGISETNETFGTVVYNSPEEPLTNVWTLRTFTFIALSASKFITVQMPLGSINTWANIDNFVLKPITSVEKVILKDSIAVITSIKKDTLPLFTKKTPVKYNRGKLNGRKCNIQETINVTDATVKLTVWDKNTVDGDMVSIYLNGQLIEEGLLVTNTKKEFTLHLQNGSNMVVMEAINLGKIPPNTATLGINNKNKSITIVSDLKVSGAIEIIVNPTTLTSANKMLIAN